MLNTSKFHLIPFIQYWQILTYRFQVPHLFCSVCTYKFKFFITYRLIMRYRYVFSLEFENSCGSNSNSNMYVSSISFRETYSCFHTVRSSNVSSIWIKVVVCWAYYVTPYSVQKHFFIDIKSKSKRKCFCKQVYMLKTVSIFISTS